MSIQIVPDCHPHRNRKMAETYPIGTRGECERLVRQWGFQQVFTWSDGRFLIVSSESAAIIRLC